MKRSIRYVAAVAAAVLHFADATASGGGSVAEAPPTLQQILQNGPVSPDASGIPNLRYAAIRETALTYGAQAGLARRSYENLKRLEAQAAELDVIYNFQPLMLEGNVVPPVLEETDDIYDQSGPDILRVIRKKFWIAEQARFTYVPPTWRAYLLMGYEFDQKAIAAVAPQTAEEKALWKSALEEGFSLGIEQADNIMAENVARLKRDIVGMALYWRLLKEGMVSKPFVASSTQKVIRADDGALHLDEVFLRITVNPDFVDDSTKWSERRRERTADRIRRSADPADADAMLKRAQAAGLIRDKR